VAIADMFLKLTGVTGEARDTAHKGEIEVVSWSWGLQAPTTLEGAAQGRAALSELTVVKRVDQSTPTLMSLLRTHRVTPSATLTVRKAGTTPLEYLRIDLTNVRVTALTTDTEGPELIDRVRLGFTRITVTYTPQQSGTGAQGGGAVVFQADAHAGT
jgi:type VI secretion system secreted protein Hcp